MARKSSRAIASNEPMTARLAAVQVLLAIDRGRTTLSAAAAIGTTISITSNTDTTTQPGTTVTMTNGDNIGIVQSDGTLFWTTISGTPGATATLASALTASATAGSYVYWFTNKAQHTLVATATRGDRTLIVVILGTYDAYGWASRLLDAGFAKPAGTDTGRGVFADLAAAQRLGFARRLAGGYRDDARLCVAAQCCAAD